jgi:RNA 2',3'-cyclic 3'-phosphodiesterase
VEGHERLRLFCALRLPEAVLDKVARWQERHLRGLDVRPVPREHLHVTLAFLGWTPAARAREVGEALRETATGGGPIELEDAARPVRETRSVGMIVLRDVHGTALVLAERLFGRLEGLGVYERDRRAWLPHVTVMRFRRPPRLRLEAPALGRFSPSDAAVYRSVLRSTGAQYEVLETVALGG